MDTAVDMTVRTYVQLSGSQMLHCTDTYNDVCDRLNAARNIALSGDGENFTNPLGPPMINVRMIVVIPDEEPAVVDACFNPIHVVCLYRAHPDV